MSVAAWIGFVVGVAMVVAALASVVVTLVVPRGVSSRLTNVVTAAVSGLFRMLAARRERYEDRDHLLSLAGPSVLVGTLTVWLLLVYLGFALQLWPFAGNSLPKALEVAGSSMFTLGFATVSGGGPTALMFLCAAVGLTVLALQVAYLPTLYSAFNRRETLVTMLESRSGVPAWGPEILARHELIDNVASLSDLYARWEEWAADLAESHTTYQVLILFRSPHPLRSWITGLLSVLDAAALHLSLNPLTAPPEARPFMRMGYMALREVATVMRIPFNPDPKPDDAVRLTREEFDEALEHVRSVGWRSERDDDEAWVHFRGWRVTYEQIAWAIADAVDAPPALWSGPRHQLGGATIAPERPPHRTPTGKERTQVLAVTRARRAAQPETTDIAAAEALADAADAAEEQPADRPG
jgi:hypothetical protein